MLRVMDKRTTALLELADFIESLAEDEFDMQSWCSCIAGHAVKREGDYGYGHVNEYRDLATKLLGLDEKTAAELFCPGTGGDVVDNKTRQQAARTLRYLAITNEVLWRD
jgi:hypothetical protein